jgi:diguanylate cyclase (GGDEF)-like protein
MFRLLVVGCEPDPKRLAFPSFECVFAAGPEEALHRLEQADFDCVLLGDSSGFGAGGGRLQRVLDGSDLSVVVAIDPAMGAAHLAHVAFDSVVDLSWSPALVDRCLVAAIERVQVGRNLVEIQRSLLAAADGEVTLLQDLAYRDELTHLNNLRSFKELFSKEHDRCRRHGRPYVVAFLDLDNLKAINLEHGHGCGSEVLAQVGETIARGVRSSDYAFRIGGDEFVVMMVEAHRALGLTIAERLCASIRSLQVPFADRRVTTTASIGVAAHPEDGGSSEAIYMAADVALYRAKALGKDRVTCFEPFPAAPYNLAPAG